MRNRCLQSMVGRVIIHPGMTRIVTMTAMLACRIVDIELTRPLRVTDMRVATYSVIDPHLLIKEELARGGTLLHRRRNLLISVHNQTSEVVKLGILVKVFCRR